MIAIPPNSATRLGLNLLLLFAGVLALRLGQTFFIPVIIALLLAAVLGPAASWLHRVLKIRWSIACVTVIFGVVLVNFLISMIFTLAVTRLMQQIPATSDEIKSFYKDFRGKLEQVWPWELDEELFPKNPQSIEQIRAYTYVTEALPRLLRDMAEYGISSLWQWILILFILLFLLLEGRMLTRRVIEIFGPGPEIRETAGSVLSDMARAVRTYLVWRTIINIGLAILVGLIYQFAGLKQAWTWAILLAILNYIPYLGPLIAGVPPFLDAFLFTSPGVAIFIFVIYWIIIIVEGYLIVPLVMGRSMELNATTVMLACLFWDLVWGMVGLFLAMPIMAGVKSICYHVPGWRPWANLMGTEKEDLLQRSV